MRPRLLDLAFHLARLALAAIVLAVAARAGSLPGLALGSAALFFGAFALMHDLAHGALRLPRRWNEAALAAAGALMLMSGHALRRLHLRHHARLLGEDDLEGQPAREGLGRALWGAPLHAIRLRVEALRSAGRAGRRWQIAEGALNLAALGVCVASRHPAAMVYAAVAIAAQLTMGIWAAHVPHNAPAWLTRAAARMAFTGSPTFLSLAYHDRHHARPDVPCQRLGAIDRYSAAARSTGRQARDASRRETRWMPRVPLSPPDPLFEVEVPPASSDFLARPVVAGDAMLLVGDAARAVAIDANTGQRRWQLDLPLEADDAYTGVPLPLADGGALSLAGGDARARPGLGRRSPRRAIRRRVPSSSGRRRCRLSPRPTRARSSGRAPTRW